jgi:hypothetical protein
MHCVQCTRHAAAQWVETALFACAAAACKLHAGEWVALFLLLADWRSVLMHITG